MDDPRIYKKYASDECLDFEVFWNKRSEAFKNRGHARAVWIWARKDVNRRAREQGLTPPLPPLGAIAHESKEPVEEQRHEVHMEGAKPFPNEKQREALWQTLETSASLRGVFSPTQDSTTFSVSQNAPVLIVLPSDFHAGGKCRYDLMRRDMQILAETDGAYAIALGDYTDNFKPQAKSGVGLYESVFGDPQLQFAYITDRMTTARGKWIAICEGNHDAWDYRNAGLRRLPDLARHLNTAFFGEGGGSVICEVGSERYVIVVKHQHPGSSRINTSNNQRKLWEEFPEWENADVIALGHLHFNDLHKVNRKGQSVVYLRAGTYKTEDEWARSKGFVPEYGVPSVVLLPDEHKVIPFRGDDFLDAVAFFKMKRAQYL